METKKSEDNKGLEFIRKNWAILIFLIGLISTWAGITNHLSDDKIHIQENERKLTDEEYKKLIQFITIVNEKQPVINKNAIQIIEINQKLYGLEIRYKILYDELEGLESKVSRNYTELNKQIKEK